MKFVIISDTHGRDDLVSEVLSIHKIRDGVLFLGDGLCDVNPLDATAWGSMFAAVRGNCDAYSFGTAFFDYPYERILNIGEYTVSMMHGHTRSVKSGLEEAVCYSARQGANVLLYGHTHIPAEKYYPAGTVISGYTLPRDMYVFNPGSLGNPPDGKHTYGLMQIRNRQILFSHGEVK
jgi:putative phosphoesterase